MQTDNCNTRACQKARTCSDAEIDSSQIGTATDRARQIHTYAYVQSDRQLAGHITTCGQTDMTLVMIMTTNNTNTYVPHIFTIVARMCTYAFTTVARMCTLSVQLSF